MSVDPLVFQALGYSAVAIGFVVISSWWLYLSPLKSAVREIKPSPRLQAWLAVLLGIASVQSLVGAWWDASQHIITGVVPGGSDFLWPPHIMIYSSFLLALIVTLIAGLNVMIPAWKSGMRDPRQWVRANPYLGAVGLACGYALLSIPGDALWHQMFGIDLTAWSPPHIFLALAQGGLILSAIALWIQARPQRESNGVRDAGIFIMLALMLNIIFLIGVLEWELPPGQATRAIAFRPIWFYPLVGGALAFFVFVLAERLAHFRWAATAVALTFYVIRFGLMAGLSLTHNIVPFPPLWYILGAILLDAFPWQRIHSSILRDMSMAAAFTAGYLALTFPWLNVRIALPPFTVEDYVATILSLMLVNILLLPVARWTSARLLGGRATLAPSTQSQPSVRYQPGD